MRIHDISMKVAPGMVHWPDSASPRRSWETRRADGHLFDNSVWSLGSHNGTHLDAPSHVGAGPELAEDVPLERLVGPARVVDVGDAPAIDAEVVARLDLAGVRRLLVRTSSSRRRLHDAAAFDETYVAFTEDGAAAVAAAGVEAVGIDFLSVERFGQPAPRAHYALFRSGVAIIEGLDLQGVPEGDYFLCFLPLRLQGSEAAPGRAILIEGLGDEATR
jgi:arylformamidase